MSSSRLPVKLTEMLSTLYTQNIPIWEVLNEFIRVLYVIIDENWSKSDWNQHIELEIEDASDLRITQDNLCEDLHDLVTSTSNLIFQKEGLIDEINEKNLKINTKWVVGVDNLTLIFSMISKM
jgi:hypothetical protein